MCIMLVSNWSLRNSGNHGFSNSWFLGLEMCGDLCVGEECVRKVCAGMRVWRVCNYSTSLVSRTSLSSTCVIQWQCPWLRSAPGFTSTVLTSCVKSPCPHSTPRSTTRTWPSASRVWRRCTRTWETRACSVPVRQSSKATTSCSISTRGTSSGELSNSEVSLSCRERQAVTRKSAFGIRGGGGSENALVSVLVRRLGSACSPWGWATEGEAEAAH